MKGIVFSQKDLAGKNIAEALIKKGFEKTSEFQGVGVYEYKDFILTSFEEEVTQPERLDELAEKYSIELIAVASRHASKSGKPTLTVHSTGNFSEAKYGGEEKSLQATNANAKRNVFIELLEDTPRGYQVSLEATHHGPTKFKTPLFFAEIGSTEKQWVEPSLGEFLAESLIQGMSSREEVTPVIGIGGNHYAKNFSKMEEDIAFGHICANYALKSLDEKMLDEMVCKTLDGVEQALIDESVKGFEKTRIKGLLDKAGIEC